MKQPPSSASGKTQKSAAPCPYVDVMDFSTRFSSNRAEWGGFLRSVERELWNATGGEFGSCARFLQLLTRELGMITADLHLLSPTSESAVLHQSFQEISALLQALQESSTPPQVLQGISTVLQAIQDGVVPLQDLQELSSLLQNLRDGSARSMASRRSPPRSRTSRRAQLRSRSSRRAQLHTRSSRRAQLRSPKAPLSSRAAPRALFHSRESPRA
ncbi:hypothetical protein HF521_013111, partial [Silurus meridionalis]